jgi:hypothetical protein
MSTETGEFRLPCLFCEKIRKKFADDNFSAYICSEI